jgi:hypothetical protein
LSPIVRARQGEFLRSLDRQFLAFRVKGDRREAVSFLLRPHAWGRVACGDGIIDNDFSGATPTFRVVTSASSDGVTVSPDGKTVYNTGVTGYDIATGNVVYGTFGVPEADGMGVISCGALNGDIVVNSNDGSVYLLDQLGDLTIIADNGSRGDYTSPDRTNGSLLLTQSDSIWRLSIAGGTIGGGPTPGVPEPSTWAMMLIGFVGLGVAGRRVARKRAGAVSLA